MTLADLLLSPLTVRCGNPGSGVYWHPQAGFFVTQENSP